MITSSNRIAISIIMIVVIIILLLIVIAWRILGDRNESETIINSSDTCTSNLQCPDGWVCQDGECFPQCISAVDCPSSWDCIDGACVPECVDDSECQSGQTCNSGTCQAIVVGCTIVSTPTGLTGIETAPDEITLSWNQAANATGYIAYISATAGFNESQAVQSITVAEPTRTAAFSGLSNGIWYLKVVATNVTCPATPFSAELSMTLSTPPVFRLCMQANPALCLVDLTDYTVGDDHKLQTTGHTTYQFHSDGVGNHLQSIDAPVKLLDPNMRACILDSGRTDTDAIAAAAGANSRWTYNPGTGHIESGGGRFLSVNAIAAGQNVSILSPSSPNGANSQWILV